MCDRCGKSGHIKSNCRVKLEKTKANVVHESNDVQQPNWENCLSIEVIDQKMNVTSVVHKTDALAVANNFVDYGKEWIVDSGCSHHATGNDSLLSNVRPHGGKKVIVTCLGP